MTYIAAHAIGLACCCYFEATGLLLVRTERGADAVDRTGLVPIALGICTWMYRALRPGVLGTVSALDCDRLSDRGVDRWHCSCAAVVRSRP